MIDPAVAQIPYRDRTSTLSRWCVGTRADRFLIQCHGVEDPAVFGDEKK